MIRGLLSFWKRVLQSLGIKEWIGLEKFLTEASNRCVVKRVEPPEFNAHEQVRVLLFRERNGQERKILFDSKAVKRKEIICAQDTGRLCNGPIRKKTQSSEKPFGHSGVQEKNLAYEHLRPSSDEQMLKEMIFGSVAISYQGKTVKVHTIRSPPQIMMSVVFPAPSAIVFRIGEQDLEESGNWNNSTSEITISKIVEKTETQLAHSVPVNVPSRISGQHEEVTDNDSDSFQSLNGHSSLPSSHLSPESYTSSLPRSGSYNSLQRRLLRNKATSIELGLQKQEEMLQNEEYSRSSGQKREKLGLSIVISLDEQKKDDERQFQDFFFTHVTLIESHMMNLKDTVVKAYLNRRNFVHFVYEGSKQLQCSIQDLYTAPRLQFPEWLTIISSSSNHHHLSSVFIQRLAKLLKEYDKKETNFFVSTLLTAVLTHHLAWVPTVIPTEARVSPLHGNQKHMPHWVDKLAKSRPYNPLWVQLGDLYGALGYPFKLAKTVVTGKKSDVILQFLQVLSYFIRCSDICEQIHEKMNSGNDKLANSNNNPRSCICKGSAESEISTNKLGIKIDSSELLRNDSESVNSHRINSGSKNHTRTINGLNYSMSVSGTKCKLSSHDRKNLLPVTDNFSPETFQTSHVNLLETNPAFSVVVTKTCNTSLSANQKCNQNHTGKTFMSQSSVPSHFANESQKQTCLLENNSCFDSLGYESMEDKQEECDKLLVQNELCKSRTFQSELNISELKGHCTNKCCIVRNQQTIDIGESIKKNIYCNNERSISKTLSFCKCLMQTECERHQSDANTLMTKQSPLLPTNVIRESNLFVSKFHESSRERQSDVSEEGYHSMEEPQSPCQEGIHLGEMLKLYDSWAPKGLTELPLPRSHSLGENTNPSMYKSFGWSLMAGVSDHYLTDFCLQGIQGLVDEEEIRNSLISSTQIPVLGEPIAEAVCIVADTDKWSVQMVSSNWAEGDKVGSCSVRVGMSSLVASVCEAILHMNELGISSESCIIHLEDRLQELYFRSQTLAEYLCSNKPPATLVRAAHALNLDASDIPLLLSIATTHSPYLTILNR